MSTITIPPEAAIVKQKQQGNEAQPQFSFADLPEKLRAELKTPTSPRCLIRADLVRALTWKKSRQRYVEAAIVLSQLIYLPTHNEGKGPDGEYAINFDDLEAYTGLSLYALASAYRYLVEIGAIFDVRHHPKWPRFGVNWAKIIELMEDGKSIREERTQRLAEKAEKRKAAAIARSAIYHGTAYHDISQDRVQRHVAAYLNNQEESKNNLSPEESQDCAHAPQNEGQETSLPSVSDSAIPNNQKEEKRVGKAGNVIPLQRSELDAHVHSFCAIVGQPKVPTSLLKHGRKQLTELLDAGWTLGNIAMAIDAIKHGPKDDRGRPVDGRGKLIVSIGYLAHIIGPVVEEAEAKRAAEERRQAQAEWRAQDEARCVREAEDYARQQQTARQSAQSEARQRHDLEQKANDAFVKEQRQWISHFLTWMREKGGGDACNASEADEMEFRRLYPPPKRAARQGFVPVGEEVDGVVVNFKSNWTAAGASA